MAKIEGGYVLLARKIFESEIWSDDLHILKLFIYLVGKARHKKEPKKYNGFEVKRGELVTSLKDISDDNEYIERGILRKWNKMKISRMLEKLEDLGYTVTLCDTYGTHLSICNYDTYQNPELYKTEESVTGLLQDCYGSVTGVLLNNNGNNGNNGKNEREAPAQEPTQIKNRDKDIIEKFDIFWNVYPRKASKKKAFTTFKSIKPKDDLFKQMLEALNKQIAAGMYEDKNFTPHATTWLNQERWNDEIIIKGNRNGTKQSTKPGSYESRLNYKFDPEEAKKRLEELKQEWD